MKKIIPNIALALVVITMSHCKKSAILTYNSVNYIQFTDNSKDTVNVSFFIRPHDNLIRVPVAVKIIGQLPEKDTKYTVEIDAKETNALPVYYTLPASFVFGKGKTTDTAYIDFHRHNDLLNKSFLLQLRITGLDDGKPGQTTFLKKVFRIEDIARKPSWWDWSMESNYLGTYTDKKFRVFMDVTGVGMLDKYSLSEQREFMLAFKHYLVEKMEDGDPVLEEDGTDMLSTVPLIG